MGSNKKHSYFLGIFTIIIAMLCLSLSGVLVKVSNLGPAVVGLYRVFFAFPFIFLVYLGSIKNNSTKSNKASFANTSKLKLLAILAGVIFGSDLVVWNKSLEFTTVANSTLLGNMSPLFTLPITAIFLKERIPKLFIISVTITILGLVILFYQSYYISNLSHIGDFMALFTAFTYAIFLTLVAKCRKRLPAVSVMFYTSLGAFISILIIALILEKQFLPHTNKELIIILVMSFLVQVCGQGGLIFGLKNVPINLTAVLVLLEPLFAAIIAFYFLQESLTALQLFGGALIILGVYLCNQIYLNKMRKTQQDLFN